MNQIDFHGYKVTEALREVEKIIGKVRSHGMIEDYTFITGRSEIQKSLSETLRKDYGLDPIVPMGNQGIIEVEIS